MHLKKLLHITSLFLLLLLASMAFSKPTQYHHKSQKPYVNILTWWGYLDDAPNQLKKIEDKCHVNISYDNYYSNNQFIDRFQNSGVNYDIIIFSQTVLDAIKKKINLPGSHLYKISKKYSPIIRNHYKKENLPHNVVYFTLSLTGFLYNPNIIHLNKNDSVKEVFDKSNNNIVVMIDDPVEANFLMSLLLKQTSSLSMIKADELSLTWKNFKSLSQNTNVIVTNEPNHIIRLPNFAFAYQWSGDAIQEMRESHGKLKFFVHPKLSYISSDLLAELNFNKNTACVAQALSGDRFLTKVQNRSFYFSPYEKHSKFENPYFKNIYNQTMHNLSKLPWILSVSMKNFKEIKNSWGLIKYKLKKENEDKKHSKAKNR